jgi:hypothetical protein
VNLKFVPPPKKKHTHTHTQNKYKHFLSQSSKDELMALRTNSNMRMELTKCKDDKKFLELLIIKWRLASDYCNVCTALIVYLTLPILLSSDERSFLMMKQIKIYLQSCMMTKRLKNLATLSTKSSASQKILTFDAVIDKYASIKLSRVILNVVYFQYKIIFF